MNGKTLHTVLQLPIRGNLQPLKGAGLMKLQQFLLNISYIVIDEFSVVGQRFLSWIDQRCRQGTGNTSLPFGGLSIILVGDIGQLPPVGDKCMFHKKPRTENETQGFMVYNKFTTVVKLTKNVRSKGEELEQKLFRKLLLNARDGKCTVDDWKLLLTRSYHQVKDADNSNYVKLSYSNESVSTANFLALQQLKEPIACIAACNNSKMASKLNADEMGGLQPKIFLSKGARIMLTRNLWLEKGLCNGSMGYVRDIIYKDGQYPPALPIAVIQGSK